MVKILAFAGSSRKASWNKKLLAEAIKGAEAAGAQVTTVELADFDMPIFCEDWEAEHGIHPGAEAFKALLKSHDGFLIASPEYNSSYSGLLKNAIDWASRMAEGEKPLEAYKGKVAALISASPGMLGGLRGLSNLRQLLQNIGTLVIPSQQALGKAHEHFDEEGNMLNEKKQKLIHAVAAELVNTASKLKG